MIIVPASWGCGIRCVHGLDFTQGSKEVRGATSGGTSRDSNTQGHEDGQGTEVWCPEGTQAPRRPTKDAFSEPLWLLGGSGAARHADGQALGSSEPTRSSSGNSFLIRF